ncbi:MAG TPA: homoserine kinase [Acidobacteriaceae bacterium]|jgi:homoserine kinase|nr:homoserine kinase [Acidobacteriaceae bacterium]
MRGVRLRLPATSANLGPGFDALAVALELYLEIEAEAAAEFSIGATGRNADVCGALEGNLLLETYGNGLAGQGKSVKPLAIRMRNRIPLGMGCGSSAAVRLAGLALAAHFGELGWDGERILTEAARLEGHPDNVAACWLGGFAASAWNEGEERVRAVSLRLPEAWRAVLVIPARPLATTVSRAVLPDRYGRGEVVENLQNTALLTAALASGRGDLVAAAMRDRLHQPYRAKECPLLPGLLPLAGRDGVLGVALSGAGPGVLLLAESEAAAGETARRARAVVGSEAGVEVLVCGLERGAAVWQE